MDNVVWNVVDVRGGNVVGMVLNVILWVVLGVVTVVIAEDEPVLNVRGG